MKNFLSNIRALFIIFAIAFLCFIGGVAAGIKGNKFEETSNDTIYIQKPLTEWQIFTLALIEVESEFNEMAVNKKSGARGILQITPIYVDECNRIQDSIFFTHTDAYNVESSICMFELINTHHDVEKAIKSHNPNAKEWYRNRILKEMDKILKVEQIKTMLK